MASGAVPLPGTPISATDAKTGGAGVGAGAGAESHMPHLRAPQPPTGAAGSDAGDGAASETDAQNIKRVVLTDSPHESHTRITNGLRRNSDFLFAFSFLGVVGMIVQNEVAWVWNAPAGYGPLCPDPTDSSCDPRVTGKMFPITQGLVVLNAIRAVISFTTLLAIIFCYKFYAIQLRSMKAKHLVPATATLLGSTLRWQFMLESCCLAIHVFPGIDSVSDDPQFYLFMNLLMFGRLLLATRCVRFHSPLLSSNGRFIGALTNVEFTSSFILKTALKSSPGTFMACSLCILLVAAGYSIRLIDNLMCVARPELNCNPITFWNAQWMLVVTILTVGYGDFVPHSDGARTVAIIGGMTGTIITAITVALTTTYLNLSRSESKVVTFLQKDQQKRLLQKVAARALQAFFHYYNIDGAAKPKHKQRAERHLYAALRRFRRSRRFVSSNDPTTPTDRQISLLETMEVNVDDIKAHVELLGGYLLGVQDMVPGMKHSESGSTVGQELVGAGAGAGSVGGGSMHVGASLASSTLSAAASAASSGAMVAAGGGGGGGGVGGGGGGGDGATDAHVQQQHHHHMRPFGGHDWMHELRDGVAKLVTRLHEVNTELHDLQTAVQTNYAETRQRLQRLEAAVFASANKH